MLPMGITGVPKNATCENALDFSENRKKKKDDRVTGRVFIGLM
jgi:hypothetical protein